MFADANQLNRVFSAHGQTNEDGIFVWSNVVAWVKRETGVNPVRSRHCIGGVWDIAVVESQLLNYGYWIRDTELQTLKCNQ